MVPRTLPPRGHHLGHRQPAPVVDAGRLRGDSAAGEPERLIISRSEGIDCTVGFGSHATGPGTVGDSAAAFSWPRVCSMASASSLYRFVGTSTILAQVGIHRTS